MAVKIKKRIKAGSNRTYLAKDFEAFRQNLIEQSRIFFPDKIKDFSEPSVAGMFVDLAATVGDSLSFYLDHQFRELDPQLSVESSNIESHLRNAGVRIFGASPAVADVIITVLVPVEDNLITGKTLPKETALPAILEGTVIQSTSGIDFNLLEDIDFAEKDANGNFVSSYKAVKSSTDGKPTQFAVSKATTVVSGKESTRTFQIADTHVAFREIILPEENISEFLSVTDSDGNEYYEVDSLSQDTVFVAVDNTSPDDMDVVTKTLEVTPAPRRFVKRMSPLTRITTIRFGSGNAEVLDDDIVPDPSELSLELYGKKSFSRFAIEPNALLKTQTLGISPRNTTLTMNYRHGGGLRHNVDANTITSVTDLSIEFRKTPSAADALFVRQNITVDNKDPGRGGQNPPGIEFLRSLIQSARNSQGRIVTREDLIARIYTLPAKFGRIFRVGLSENPTSPLSLLLYVISLDSQGRLSVSPDSLKRTLSTYLNEFRLISDAIDVLDARVINYSITYEVLIKKEANKQNVLQQINRSLAEVLRIRFFQIDQPIITDDIVNIIINGNGVVSLTDLRIMPKTGLIEDRAYSTFSFPFESSTKKGILRGPEGSIFELRFPEDDITGYAI